MLENATVKLEKLTETNPKRPRRYEDGCGMAHALDLIGDRWALLIVRELMLGPKRFSDIRADLPGLSANTLTQRLAELERNGIVLRQPLAPPAAGQAYGLTEWGYQSKPIMGALARWATRSPAHDVAQNFSPVSLILSFQAMGQPGLPKQIDARYGFRFGRESYVVTIRDGAIGAERGDAGAADAVFTGTPRAVAAAVYGGVPLAELEADGALAIAGDRALAAQFVTLFPLPPKAGA